MSEIHWKRAVGGAFSRAGAWKGDVVPGPTDDALLEATGADYTVTSDKTESVASIQLAANATLNITDKTFTASAGTGAGANAGTIGIYGKGVLSLGGMVDNTGTITLNNAQDSKADATTVMISSNTTLSGGGTIDLSDSFYNNIVGNGTTLTNVDNVISGSGLIGSKKVGLTFVNEAGGIVNSIGANSLEIGTRYGHKGRSTIVNDGLFESTSGSLVIKTATFSGTGGSIVAGGGKSVLFLDCTVSGQSFSTQTDSEIGIVNSAATDISIVANEGVLGVEGVSSSLALVGPIDNAGELIVDAGSMIVTGPVSGAGQAVIYTGKLEFDSTFNQNVTFGKNTGRCTLLLEKSQSYGGNIFSFSPKGASILDLRDIGFVSTAEATFSGNSTSGVLTVTDGTHTAHINLEGDYLSTNFVASSDGHNGTTVAAASGGALAPPHGFVAALAGLGGSTAAGAVQLMHVPANHDLALTRPHAVTA